VAEESREELEFEELTQRILGCAITVQRKIGPGLIESTYEACFVHELRKAGLKAIQQLPMDIEYDDLVVPNAFRMDLFVEDQIVIELKAVERLLPVHEAQLMTYLRFSNLRLGLLLNFWAWPLKDGGIKRVLNSHL